LDLVPPDASLDIVTSDNCGGVVTVVLESDVITGQTCPNNFTIQRTYVATDDCGNFTSCVQIIQVSDLIPPTIECPIDVTVSCLDLVPPDASLDIVTSDNCGGVVTVVLESDVITGQTCPNNFTIQRTYVATDDCGNSATCAQTITVNDITPPSITCPANVAVSCASSVPPASTASVTASDLCGGTVTIVHVGDVITNQTCANRFTIIRTYRATDVCGNSATCAQTITVNDITPPTFNNPPANGAFECNFVPGVSQNLTTTDNCTGPVTILFLGEIQAQGICPILYTLTRSWSATDACGNSVTVSQVLTVVDTQAPEIQNPVNVVVECDPAMNQADYQNWLDTHGGATASDCSTITWTYENSPFPLDTSGCAGTFRRFIRFIATDECGNSSFRDARFTVVDTTPPTFTILPQNLDVECWMGEEGEAQMLDWLDHFGFAEVSDDCGSVTTEVVFLSHVLECGITFTRTYQFRATDECGNTTYVTATFSIVDTTPPVITCPEGNVLLTCEFDIPAPDTAGVMAMDMCGAVTITVESIFSYGVGCPYWPLTTSYTYAATDECGNVSTCYQSFQVVDSIPPTYTGPDTIFVLCVADLPGPGDLTDILAPYFVDNCYDVICVGESVAGNGVNWVTYCVNYKDLCVNWAPKFFVTFVANGGCKPLCTAPQDGWGNASVLINGMSTTEAIEQMINKHGAIKAGKLGKVISVTSAACLQSMLPGNGTVAQFSPAGQHVFGTANDCNPGSPVLNSDGTLKNKVAANVLALQLNVWYNQDFNDRNLAVQLLSSLPPCLVDDIVLDKLEVDQFTVQGLLNLSNNYLAGVGFYLQNFGIPLNSALENVNAYWRNCQLNDPCSTVASVSGSLKTEAQDGLEEGQLQLAGSNNSGPMPVKSALTDVAGFYQFSNAVPFAGSYTLTPTAEGKGYLNGVTTYDIALISKHILGWAPLTSPYKMIAADANKSGSITSFDIVELRKLILGIYDELPENTSWRFVDKSFVFPNLNNPFSTLFPESKTVENIQSSHLSEDFVAIKIGDLNGTAMANNFMTINERSVGTLLFDVEDRSVESGETFELKMTADQMVQGFQFTLNTDGLEVLEVSGEGMNAGNFAVFAAEEVLTT
ncbi:MAG: hypothetical protein Q7T20_00360, partial [Saprospiraceae bacterium]|nr:hypothetical protein [Saprospiraceae bacterium]